jgi:hypothetical protein
MVNFILSQLYPWEKAPRTDEVVHAWSDNKVHKVIAVKVVHTSLLNVVVVVLESTPLGSHAPMPAPSPSFKTIFELVLWNGLQSCHCITPDVVNVIRVPLSSGTEKAIGG